MKEELNAEEIAPLSLDPERAALLASVDTLPVSEELKERWRAAAREDARLRLPVFFVRCADMGYACLPTLIRRAFAERNVAFEDLHFVYQTLGAQHADAQRMIFTPEELAAMELDELLAGGDEVSAHLEAAELTAAVNQFLAALDRESRILFVRRYWHLESTADLAAALGLTEGTVRVRLHRTRAKLKAYLKRRKLL